MDSKRFVSYLCLTVGLLGAAQAQQADAPVTVQTDHGAVVGRLTNVQTFRGIPYAAPPVAEKRWTAPQPAPAWTAPRDTSNFGNVCPQVVLALFPVPGKQAGDAQGDEDCLYLNVYAPKSATSASKLPVMVWIHGGAFTVGSGGEYDGSVLAEKYGVVVVTFNYRLGALGFLALDSLNAQSAGGQSGNYGLQDQQAAIRWVQANIAAFGGNPADLTLAGESAGGMSVCANLASPLAAGLFQKAIIQSGLCASPGNSVTQQGAATRNRKYISNLGCKPEDLACLRNVDVSALLKTKVPGLRTASNLVWSPVYGTDILPLTLLDAYTGGKFNRVPVLAGTNHDEGRLFVQVAAPGGKPVTPVLYWGGAGLLVGVPKLGRALAQYPYRRYNTPALAFATLFTDGVFSCPAQAVNTALAKYVPVYSFEFNDPQAVTNIKGPSDLPGLGAFHGSSLVYAFQTPVGGAADPAQFSAVQNTLSDNFSAAWANFIKTGNPNPAGQSAWRAFDAQRNNVQVFAPGSVQESVTYSAEHKCAFWSGLALK
jgi:para-nitrobenzyl esterase